MLLFVDVCKAGTIGSIQNTTVNADVQHLGDVEGDLFGLLASRPKEVSLEGPQFGGGHGVFSYFVMKGLEGAADDNKDGVVDAERADPICHQSGSDGDRQQAASARVRHLRQFACKLSDVRKPGINVAHWRMILDSRSGEPLYLASASPSAAGSIRLR